MEENFYSHTGDDRESGGYDKDKISFLVSEAGSNKKILDVGCNDGFFGKILLERNNQVYGIDFVKKNLAKARALGVRTKYFKIGKGPLPYTSDFFDIVYLGDVIEHIFDTDTLLRECYRVLKKGGKLIITTPNVASFGRRLLLLFGISPFLEYSLELTTNNFPSVGHIRYYTAHTLQKQLEYHRFIIKKMIGNGVYFASFLKFRSLGKILPSFSSILLCVAIK